MLWIDKNKCVGCGICVNICPEGIEIINGKARVKNENANCLKDAANSCPQGAIVEGENKEIESNTGFNQGYGRRMGADEGRGLGISPRDGKGGGRGSSGRRR